MFRVRGRHRDYKFMFKSNPISELRQDIVTQDWVVIATGRARRPQDFLTQKRVTFTQPKTSCPFERVHKGALSLYSKNEGEDKKSWWVQVIPNKYPAFGSGTCALFHNVGPYQWTEGVGFHEVVVTKDHTRSLALMSIEEIELVVRAYQDRYLAMQVNDCVEYVSLFHNHGRGSGATISHPHSQIVAIPVIPPDIAGSLRGSAIYFRKNKKCVHCAVLAFERRVKERVVYENEDFLGIAPFASRTAFELRLFPKRHNPHFEIMVSKERNTLSDALKNIFLKLYKGLKNPDYNFFIHTAPTSFHGFDYYHWHLEIVPKTAVWAGFEIGTGIEISTIAPESAARFLRSIR